MGTRFEGKSRPRPSWAGAEHFVIRQTLQAVTNLLFRTYLLFKQMLFNKIIAFFSVQEEEDTVNREKCKN